MTCANALITIFAAVILVFTFWPSLLSAMVAEEIIILSAIIIIILAWTCMDCKLCKNTQKKDINKKNKR